MAVTTVSELTEMEYVELDQRRIGGIVTTLFVGPSLETFKVSVRDENKEGEDLDVYVLDAADIKAAYLHPYAYAAHKGVVAVPPDGFQREPLRALPEGAIEEPVPVHNID